MGGGGGGGGAPLEPLATPLSFSTTLGSQTYALPAEAVEGTWVVFIYLTGGTNSIGGPPTGWTTIAETQRVAAYYKQIGAAETVVPAIGASNGYPFAGFLVFDQEIVVSQAYAGIANGSEPQPANLNIGGGVFQFATKTAVPSSASVYGARYTADDVGSTAVAPATLIAQSLTLFGSDHAAGMYRQDGAGADISMQYNCTLVSAGISFVVEAA